VSSSKKLFIAAMLVAAGYGVASLLGAPESRLWRDGWAPLGSESHRPTAATSVAANASAGPNMVGSVRLLPESSVASPDRRAGSQTVAIDAPNSTAPPELAVASAAAAETLPMLRAAPSSQLSTARPAPRAALKNEAPRPLPAAKQQAAPVAKNQVDPTAFDQVVSAVPVPASNKVMTAGFASDPAAFGATIRAPNQTTSQQVVMVPRPALVSPPPWPMADPEPPRTHVIVDGDSLAKLAGRYLDDPRRSEEIFTFNRGVLSDPELLPIGVELKIPPRGVVGDSRDSWPQSQMVGTSSIHAAEHTGLVPVRSLPPTPAAMPRAQLLPPRPVE
jgi:nucleoid-associated protein YgaU